MSDSAIPVLCFVMAWPLTIVLTWLTFQFLTIAKMKKPLARNGKTVGTGKSSYRIKVDIT